MTPKEKAIELVDKFSLGYYHFPNAKQCALIAVNEIIGAFPSAAKYTSRGRTSLSIWDYFLEVKTEIENL
jgi:hypothetical protein